MISAEGVKRHAMSMYNAKAIYVWGADVQVLTRVLFDNLKKKFGAEHYTDIDLDRDEGKLGADCSGMLTPISGYDSTADGYYQKCKVKGPASSIIKDKVCLVFRKEGNKIVHVGIYTGDGYTVEMYNGCERKKFNASSWTYWGQPDWIEYPPELPKAGSRITTTKTLKGYNTAADAVAGKNAKTTLEPGKYYVYKVYKGSVNISKTKGVPGSWGVL